MTTPTTWAAIVASMPIRRDVVRLCAALATRNARNYYVAEPLPVITAPQAFAGFATWCDLSSTIARQRQ